MRPVHPGEVLREDYLYRLVDGYIVVSLDETKKAMRLMAEKTRVMQKGLALCRWPRH